MLHRTKTCLFTVCKRVLFYTRRPNKNTFQKRVALHEETNNNNAFFQNQWLSSAFGSRCYQTISFLFCLHMFGYKTSGVLTCLGRFDITHVLTVFSDNDKATGCLNIAERPCCKTDNVV